LTSTVGGVSQHAVGARRIAGVVYKLQEFLLFLTAHCGVIVAVALIVAVDGATVVVKIWGRQSC
jgi:hypothetical protein